MHAKGNQFNRSFRFEIATEKHNDNADDEPEPKPTRRQFHSQCHAKAVLETTRFQLDGSVEPKLAECLASWLPADHSFYDP
jgi:hypothetical protein